MSSQKTLKNKQFPVSIYLPHLFDNRIIPPKNFVYDLDEFLRTERLQAVKVPADFFRFFVLLLLSRSHEPTCLYCDIMRPDLDPYVHNIDRKLPFLYWWLCNWHASNRKCTTIPCFYVVPCLLYTYGYRPMFNSCTVSKPVPHFYWSFPINDRFFSCLSLFLKIVR